MVVAPLSKTFVFLFHCRAPDSCSSHWSPLGGAVCLQDRVDKVPLGTSSTAQNQSSTVHRAVTSGAWRSFAAGSSGPSSSCRFCSGLLCPVKRFSCGSLKNQPDLVLKVRLIGVEVMPGVLIGEGSAGGGSWGSGGGSLGNLLVLEGGRGGFQRRWLRSSDLLLGCSGFGRWGVHKVLVSLRTLEVFSRFPRGSWRSLFQR